MSNPFLERLRGHFECLQTWHYSCAGKIKRSIISGTCVVFVETQQIPIRDSQFFRIAERAQEIWVRDNRLPEVVTLGHEIEVKASAGVKISSGNLTEL